MCISQRLAQSGVGCLLNYRTAATVKNGESNEGSEEKAGLASWMPLSTQQQPGESGVWNVVLAPLLS
jgi:hypothetical protein